MTHPNERCVGCFELVKDSLLFFIGQVLNRGTELIAFLDVLLNQLELRSVAHMSNLTLDVSEDRL